MKSVKRYFGEGTIGLYNIARKSTNHITFDITYYDIELKIFTLQFRRLILPERKLNE